MAMCGVKFRAYPTLEQSKKLAQWIGCSRVIYNGKVDEDQSNYRLFKETGQQIPVNQAFSHLKTEERIWLKECPSQILRNSAVNWFTAKQRFFKKLAQNPTKKRRGQKDSVLLTNELFSFKEVVDLAGTATHQLFIGTKTKPLGFLRFVAHREFNLPKQIVISKKNQQWFVSFCYEVEGCEKTEEELLKEFSSLDEISLKEMTVGIDRGVVIPFQLSDNQHYNFDIDTQRTLLKKQKRLKRYQKRLSRQKLKSNARNKTKKKIGRLHTKIGNIRHDFCHKTSHSIVNSDARVIAVEDLKLKNMTKAPKPKQDEQGRYIPNGASAKAGLNKALLSKGLGKTVSFIEYKARRQGKLVVKVPSAHSSQECAHCGHIHPDNRKTQSAFLCLSCGNHDNADLNAAKVIANRAVKFLLSKPNASTKTRLGTSRSKVRRGTSKTQIEETLFAQVPMTLEALPL